MSSRRPAILYLVHRAPFPPDKGDRIRTYQILRHLARRADVHLACLADEPLEPHVVKTLEGLCKRVAIVDVRGPLRWGRGILSLATGGTVTEGAFHSPQLQAIVRSWGKDTRFDRALASASSMVQYLRLEELQGVPAVVDLIDVDSQKWYDYAATVRGPKSWLYRLEGRRLRRLEQDIVTWAQAVTLVSAAEVDILRRSCSDGRVMAIGNGVDLDYFQPRPQGAEHGCVFLGALDYWPNVEGISWFCREIWPEVRRRCPDATLSLVGRQPTPAVSRLTQIPGVKLVGQVPDVRPYVAQAAASIVPLRIARGVQNKVLESMAMGKATVVSAQALEGLHAQPGTELLSASTPSEWIDAVSRLLEAADVRHRIGAAARLYVERYHRWQRCLEPFDMLLGLACDSCRTPALTDPSHPVMRAETAGLS